MMAIEDIKSMISRASGIIVIAVFVVGGLFVYKWNESEHHTETPPNSVWGFEVPFGTFDRAELQRGFQVYEEVCASCHGLDHLSYRHLSALGFKEPQIKAIAAKKEVPGELDDEGNPTKRPGKPSDRFANPFPNENAARAANNGAFPPDLSLVVKGRKFGVDYVRAYLTGYATMPPEFKLAPGMYYNRYFLGHQTAMPPPLSDGLVQYADGTPATVEQMARDVTAFLSWASEPEMEARKNLGVKALTFILIFTIMMFFVMRRTWARVK